MSEPSRRQRRQTLTDKMVEGLPKQRNRYFEVDPEQRGHYVRVMPEGSNVFVCVARDPYGKQVWHTIGSADVLKIEEAREQARKAIRRIKAGSTPTEPLPVKPDNFKAVAESWLHRHVKKEKLRTRAEIERVLTKYVLPHWKNKDFIKINRSDITSLLDYVEDHHGRRQADVVLTNVRSIANWFAIRNDDYISPITRRMRRSGKQGKRARILDDDELRRVWKQAESNGSFGALIRMLLLTGQRRGAVLRMRWSDISTDHVWEIPTEERENGNAGLLQLSKATL